MESFLSQLLDSQMRLFSKEVQSIPRPRLLPLPQTSTNIHLYPRYSHPNLLLTILSRYRLVHFSGNTQTRQRHLFGCLCKRAAFVLLWVTIFSPCPILC